MTIVIISNIVFAGFVLAAILGSLAWTILTDRPQTIRTEQPRQPTARRPELHGRARGLARTLPGPARG